MVAQEVPTSTAVALPHGPAGVAEARRRLRTDLYARGVPEPVVDDAVLILSELISNSCRHARPLGDDVLDGLGAGSAGSGTGGGDTMRTPEDRAGVQTPARHPGRPQRPERAPRPRGGILAAWSVDDGGMLVLEVTDGGGPTRPRPSSLRDAPGEVTVWALLPVRGRHARRDTPMGTGIGLPVGVPLGLPLDLAESLDDLG
jgi:hypothetical protein